MSKKTIILGATPNPERYAYKATESLVSHGHEAIPVGIRKGIVAGIEIQAQDPNITDIDTITLYIGAVLQPQYYDYILQLKPKRIIFNPGTENPELVQLAKTNNIEPVIACTLVLLAIGDY